MALCLVGDIMRQLLPSSNQLLLCLVLITTVGYDNFGVRPAGGRQYEREKLPYSRGNDKFGRTEGKPYFKPTQQNITVHPGDRAVLHCRVENLGTKSVSWRKEGIETPLTIGLFTFAPDTRMHIDNNVRTREWNLIIQAVKPEDEGWYRCQVTTKLDQIYYSVQLNVLTVQVTGTQYVEKGNIIQLICNATGKPDPPHNVDWFKDGEKLESDAEKGIIITKKIETKVLVSMLVIKNSRISDAADYICRSSNNDAGSINVHVLNVAAPNIDKRDKELNAVHQNSPMLGGAYSGSGCGNSSFQSWTLHTLSALVTVLLWLHDTRWRRLL